MDYFKTLGIFSTEYNLALDLTWKQIYERICKRINLIRNRNYTLYQKACIVNSLLASKIWYVAHVYPFPMDIATRINTEIFKFIWGSNRDPIKRDVLCNLKEHGGIGLINIFTKAKSIFLSTTLKMIMDPENETIRYYYMKGKIDKYIKLDYIPKVVSRKSTPYYDYALNNIKKIHKLPNFPKLSSKEIYCDIRTEGQPRVENKNQSKKWKDIWKNLKFKYIPIHDRNIVFKFIHDIIPTHMKLYQMKLRNSPNCSFCPCEDTAIHKFYLCLKIQKAIKLVKNILEYVSNMKFQNIEKMLYLEIPNIQNKTKNSMIIIICNFISCTWLNRDNLEYMEEKIVSKIYKEKEFLLTTLNDKSKEIFCSRYSEMDIRKLNSLYGTI